MNKKIANTIVEWYRNKARDLPWRETKDPYKIWLSEIILQQTRVAQGLPYYHKFIERFPTLAELSGAELDEVLKLWEGLGYYSRARNMHQTARLITKEHNGRFPDRYEDLLAQGLVEAPQETTNADLQADIDALFD